MKKLLALGAVLMFATTANAAVIWFGIWTTIRWPRIRMSMQME
jgi:hypothetical protein